MDEPVTVTVAHQVAPGREEEFSDWATAMLGEAAHYVEYLGGGVLGPGGTEDDWHIVYRWSSQEAAQQWELSPVRTRLAASAAGFTRAGQTRRTTGVRTWFDLPARITKPPPKWKSALVTLLAVFPPVLLFNVTVIPYLGGVSVVLRTFALCVGVTAVVTWVMMPRLLRLLRNFLNPPASGETAGDAAPPPDTRPTPGRRSPRGGGGERDVGYGTAEPTWLVEVAPRGRGAAASPGPWYASRHQLPEPEARYGERRDPGRYRERSEPGSGFRERREPVRWHREEEQEPDGYREERKSDRRYQDGEEAYPEAARSPRYARQQPRHGRAEDLEEYDEPDWTRARNRGPGTGRYRR